VRGALQGFVGPLELFERDEEFELERRGVPESRDAKIGEPMNDELVEQREELMRREQEAMDFGRLAGLQVAAGL